ncbi:MAG TPA: AI-2E family transporter [Halieaceae bacterium]|jgi:predicted PurR-regulated permease PerM|uniref:AI-2E family transporter n=1 Tax=Haliea TaxID=475794 RepID=UPI000C59BB3F|nr:AI-2E family transporter [Haliea sp.]HAN67230.1 AI-2E family transporter [Halieaceae bacterium]MAD63707.1 AI-2E family transporter [Haliea sp.]MAY92068.1 AI-2E family transporter [Haliea sp.]MBK41992.1 AI-2E family transporter [Haliea sp.]MBP70000.1 AI-2E family transporter [Haliea sp.]|tara:strand:+ start:5641 stop:6762 length:1122 start_codon:yes stop_codon:yes gene_type:complete
MSEARLSPGTLSLRILAALAVLYTVYFAKSLLMPVFVALFFALLLNPLVKLLKRFYVPRTISAVLILALIGGPVALLGSQLAEPAQRWAEAIPRLTEKLSKEVDDLTDKLSPQAEKPPQPEEGFSFFGLFGSESDEAESNDGEKGERKPDRVSERLKQGGLELLLATLGAAPVVIAQLLTTVLLILFLLIFGSRLFAAFVDIFPGINDQRASLELVHTVQVELSRYILTVSLINACLGLSVGGVLWLLGVQDPMLWGVMVGMLNFAPYVGPLLGVVLLVLAGVVQYGPVAYALLPALVYFSINLVEAQVITPLVLGRNMRLNPLVILVWLLVWGWLWGFVGVLLAVPLLVCLKLAFGQTTVLRYWMQLIETRA